MRSGEGLRVQVVQCLQFCWSWVMSLVWRCHTFVFGASADSQEQVEDRPHCITSSDGGTASRSDATSSGEGGGEEITTALTAKSSAPRELQIFNNIDPAGEFKVPLAYADEASQPTDAAAKRASAQCQTPPPRRSLEDSTEQGTIITAQRTPELAFQDVKIGQEDLVINPCFMKIESLNQDDICPLYYVRTGVDAVYEDRFRELGMPASENAAAGGLPVEAKRLKGSAGHVPPSVSEGSVSTFAMHVDKTKTTLVPSLEKRRTAAGECAEVLANLEQTPPTPKRLQVENDGSDSLGQGSFSSSFM